MSDEAAQWEYLVRTLYANAEEQQDFLEHAWPDVTFPRLAPQALIPGLNAFGAEGWELVSAEPVIYGANGDVQISSANMNIWTNAYLCFYKRRKSAS